MHHAPALATHKNRSNPEGSGESKDNKGAAAALLMTLTTKAMVRSARQVTRHLHVLHLQLKLPDHVNMQVVNAWWRR
jgi:hypothetical protein